MARAMLAGHISFDYATISRDVAVIAPIRRHTLHSRYATRRYDTPWAMMTILGFITITTHIHRYYHDYVLLRPLPIDDMALLSRHITPLPPLRHCYGCQLLGMPPQRRCAKTYSEELR